MSTRLELRVETRIADVHAGEWNALTASRSFASHRWIRLTEGVATTFEPRYVLATRGSRLVAAAVCSVDRFGNPAAYERRLLARHVARVLRPLLPTLSCALPLTLQPGLLLPDTGERSALAAALLERIGVLAATEHAPSIRLAHHGDDVATQRQLEGASYRCRPELPNMRLDVAWPSLAAYESSLSHKRRSELRRVRRRAGERGVSIEVAQPSDDADPALRRMIGAVIRRHASLDPWVDDLLPQARALLGGDAIVLVARRVQHAVGSLVLLRSRDDLLLKWPGLDHESARESFAYRALLAASVEHAIATDARRLWLGPTAYELKRDLGAVAEPRHTYVRERGRVLHWLARRAGAGERDTVTSIRDGVG